MNPKARTAIVIVMLCPFLFGCFCCGGCGVDQQKNDLTTADQLFNAGNHAAAAVKYKSVYASFWTNSTEKQRILPRIVEHEAKVGNLNEATTWIKRALSDKLRVEYAEPKAQELSAAAQKEHEAAEEANRVERERRQAEASERAARANPLTAAKYRSIQTGMSFNEVIEIIGARSEELSRVELGGFTTVLVSWSNQNGSNMNVTFQNGKVIAKAQFGLR